MALLALCAHDAWSQRTIKLVVPVPPGASTDFVARLMAEQIARAQGVTMVIENRPGASGMIGTEAVSRAAPDGTTLLMTANTYLIDAQVRKASYHPVTGFEPLCFLVESPAVLVVNSASPYRTLADLLNAARARPGELTMASVGPGTSFQIGFVTFTRMANVSMTYVPYAGSAPAVNAVLGEHVTSVFAGYAVVAEHLKAGKLRPLATATRKRVAPLPEVPTFDESGFKELEVDNWFGVTAGKDAEGDARPARRLVHRCARAARGQGAARRSGPLSRRHLRRGLRGAHSQALRRIRRSHSRGQHQGRIGQGALAGRAPRVTALRRAAYHRPRPGVPAGPHRPRMGQIQMPVSARGADCRDAFTASWVQSAHSTAKAAIHPALRRCFCMPPSAHERRIQRDLRVQQLGHGTAGLRLGGELVELRLVGARHLRLQGEMHGGDGEAVGDLVERDLGGGVHALGGELGLAEDQRQRHGEAAGMGGADQLLGIGAGLAFEAA
jgi:tripartite-type tricarboxylate transporter receptor subunit TctC